MDGIRGDKDDGGIGARLMRLRRRRRSRPTATDLQRSGQVMGLLFLIAGLLVMLSVVLPAPPGFQMDKVLLIGVIAATAGVLCLITPWPRMPLKTQMAMVVVAFGMITYHNTVGGLDAFRYGIFFMVVFVWLGLFQPRWTSARYAPLAAVAYLVPLLLSDARASDFASATYAIPLFITVGEVLAHATTRLRSLEARLRHLAAHDGLTGLANRSVFDEMLSEDRPGGLAVVFIDLDDFKAVNDRYGHAAGDRVLIEVAEALMAAVRPADLVCRLAGDEFVVLVTGPDPMGAARAVAARVTSLLSGIRCPDGRHVSASIGVACDPDGHCDDLLAVADAAMYEAKRAGKGRVVLIDSAVA